MKKARRKRKLRARQEALRVLRSVGITNILSRANADKYGEGYPPSPGWQIRVATAIISGSQKKKPPKRQKKKASRDDKFYSSWEWKKVRYEAIKRDGRKCLCCGWSPDSGSDGHLVVDHIKPRKKYPELALDLSNLQVICNSCNMGKSDIHEDDFRGK